MRTFARKRNQPQQQVSAKTAKGNPDADAVSHQSQPNPNLRWTYGKQAILQLLQGKPHGSEVGPDVEGDANIDASPNTEVDSQTPTTTRIAHDFGQIPVPAPAPITLQPKLAVNAPGDIYEQEADHVAEQVMRMPEPKLQRACACGGGCPSCQSVQPSQEHQRLQTKHVGSSDSGQTEAPLIVHEVLASPGQPLDTGTRGFMEPRFGHDFSHVRVHSDSQAERSAQAVQARAFTIGPNIVFGAGQYEPEAPTGKSLLAHELAHTIQSAPNPQVLRREPADRKKPKEPPKRTEPEWELELFRYKPNEVGIRFNNFMVEREVLPIVFKAGTVPAVFQFVGSGGVGEGGSTPTTRWFLTVPSGSAFASASKLLEPRFANRLAEQRAQQREVELKKTDQEYDYIVQEERAAFRAHHSGHSVKVLDNIDNALKRVTRNNPNLLAAYYRYYSFHELTDDTDDLNEERETGVTSSGDTDINPSVLNLDSAFDTSDRTKLSLLGSTLIHEYAHTPQGPKTNNWVEKAQFEAKAYAIEKFLAEHQGDQDRAEFIRKRSLNDSLDMGTGADKIFRHTYNTMQALYEVIDEGGPDAKEAREMSVELISKNSEDYSPKLMALYKSASQ